jgi:hypothetical protein
MKTRSMIQLLMALALFTRCSCERSIDIEGDQDVSTDSLADVAIDTMADPMSDSALPDGIAPDGTPLDVAGDGSAVDVPTTDVPWDPPIDNLGEPGWRDSVEPVCREDGGHYRTVDIWSDDRGVFVAIPLFDSIADGARILMNEGTGWFDLTAVMGTGPEGLAIEHLTGLPGGDLFGWSQISQLTVIDPSDGTVNRPGISLMDLWVVDENLAYGLISGDPNLVKYEDGSWGPYPGETLPYDVIRVWGDETSVFVGGENGIVMTSEDGTWIVHDTGTLSAIVSFWGFSGTDLWAGTSSGKLMHYDGSDWAFVSWPDPGDDADDCRRTGKPINGMWGADGMLFLHTGDALLMYDGHDFTILGYWPGTQTVVEGINYCAGRLLIQSIWGNSPNEVFLAVEESEISLNTCEEYVLWWDGTSFHWF